MTGILMVHGIQGSPAQFRFLEERLPENTKARSLLLPGHGAGVKEFRVSGRDGWLAAVRQAAGEMREQCGKPVFVGHSMGCLLGLAVERESPGTFSGMVLVCCPFRIRPTARYLRYGFLAFLPEREGEDRFVRAAREANGVALTHPAQILTCANPYLELLRLVRAGRKNGAAPACPVRFFFSERDEIVSPRCAAFVRERFGAEPEILPESGHNFFSPEGKNMIAGAVNAMAAEAART